MTDEPRDPDAEPARREPAPPPPPLTAVPWRRLLRYLRPHWKAFGGAIVALLISTGAGLLLPIAVGRLVGAVEPGGDSGALDQVVALLIGIAAVMAVASFVQSYLLGVTGERIVATLRQQLYARLVTLSLEFHARRRVGELISRLSSDVTQVRALLTQTVTSLLSSVVGLVGAVVILAIASPTLLLLVLVLAPALIVVAVVVGRPLQRLATQVQDALARSTTTAEEALGGIRVVKSFVREDWEIRRYDRDLGGVVGMATRLIAWRGAFGGAMTFLGFAALAVILWWTGRQVIEGALTLGALTAFLLYGVTIGSSLGTLASLYGQFREGAGAVSRVFELLDEQPTVTSPAEPRRLGHVEGRITFDAVTFAYAGGEPVLRDLDLDIAPGEVLALVGPSGSGKTTLCNLIPRLWDVTAGAIRVDGTDIRDVALDELRGAIGLVPQEATLFGGTVRENIAYGRPGATDAEIEAAAVAANAHDFISALPQGYDTPLGDRGMRLSGGQRQRVAIARAILKDPRILLLDEATSALDNESERLVQEALERLMATRTTIVVAHRLSTIRRADRIAVLDDGWLMELGTRDELLAKDGLYARLDRLQWADRPSAPEPLEVAAGA
ncbi:MAG: ABC transporter ATP-binding protein [Chloroflexota bacterium]